MYLPLLMNGPGFRHTHDVFAAFIIEGAEILMCPSLVGYSATPMASRHSHCCTPYVGTRCRLSAPSCSVLSIIPPSLVYLNLHRCYREPAFVQGAFSCLSSPETLFALLWMSGIPGADHAMSFVAGTQDQHVLVHRRTRAAKDHLVDLDIVLPDKRLKFAAPHGLRGLQRLKVAGDGSRLVDLLSAISPTRLLSLEIASKLAASDSSQLLEQSIFSAIGVQRYSTLRRLEVDIRKYAYHDSLLTDLVQPLLCLNALEYLELRFFFDCFRLSDADVRAMARAWTKLAVFILTLSDDHGLHAGVPSLYALVELARGCPRLRFLSLPAVHLETPQDPKVRLVAGRELKVLQVRVVPGAHGTWEPLRAADFMDSVFPALKDVSKEVLDVGFGGQEYRDWGDIFQRVAEVREKRVCRMMVQAFGWY
ncbi:hypothetical protein B0H21DRAFT_745395 [Amylocystis lapponica]|nr:hypothetical protein B0H21DRAFT_745395 [Amylocystis lapponica]